MNHYAKQIKSILQGGCKSRAIQNFLWEFESELAYSLENIASPDLESIDYCLAVTDDLLEVINPDMVSDKKVLNKLNYNLRKVASGTTRYSETD